MAARASTHWTAWRLRQLCDLPPGHRRIRGGQRHHAWIGGVGRRVPWRICAGSPSQGPAQPWRSLLHRDHIHRPSCLYGVRDLCVLSRAADARAPSACSATHATDVMTPPPCLQPIPTRRSRPMPVRY
eukprot:scaffold6590_cov30-Tisochrysis_lutea.AAC.2